MLQFLDAHAYCWDLGTAHRVQEFPPIHMQERRGLGLRELVTPQEFHHQRFPHLLWHLRLVPTETREHLVGQLDFKTLFRHLSSFGKYCSLNLSHFVARKHWPRS